MRISYDPEVDALSISFRDTTVTTQELADMSIVHRSCDNYRRLTIS